MSRNRGDSVQRFVVTNYRFTDEFCEEIVKGFFQQTPLLLECEQAVLGDTPTDKQQIAVVCDSMSMIYGQFICTGMSGNEAFRLEEEMGTLYLSVT